MGSSISDTLSLDRKDRTLLEILAQNCRVTYAVLAAAIRVSKDTVVYRLKRLERAGLLRQYVLFIDARRLGFTRYHLLLRMKTQPSGRAAAVQALKDHPAVMWVNTFLGRYDLQVIVDAEDGFALNSIREELFRLTHNEVSEYTILTHLCDLEFTQLNPVLDLGTLFERRKDQSFSDRLTVRRFPVGMEFQRHQLDHLELQALDCLASDPRMGVSDLALALRCDRLTARRKVLSLISNKVILNFGAIPNLPAMGFVTYYLLARLRQDTPLSAMRKPFSALRNIFYAGRITGDYDMIVYLNARTPDELNESVTSFKADLSGYIMHYDLLIQDRVHHWRQFTPYIHDQCRRRLGALR